MENCLVTKLKSTVNNDTLSILGKGKIRINSESDCSMKFTLSAGVVLKTLDGSDKLRIAGLTSEPVSTLSFSVSQASNYNISFSAGDYYVTIDSVYSVNFIKINNSGSKIVAREYTANNYILFEVSSTASADCIDFDGYDFNNLKRITVENAGFVFDVSNLKKSSIIEYISLIGRNIGGNITGAFAGKAVTGPNNRLVIQNTNVYGNIDSLADGVFVGLSLNNNDSGKKNDITGNLALMPSSCKLVNFNGNNCNFTWTGTRTGYAMSISRRPNLGEYVDAMLINQAACDLTAPLSQLDKSISVNGTHNPENTDAVNAIATIKAAGWNVYINGTQM